MATATLEKKTEISDGPMGYRVSGMEKKLDDVVQDIREIRSQVSNLDLRLNSRIDKLDSRIDKLDSKLESKIDKLDSKLNLRIDKLDSRIGQLESKLDSRTDKLESRMDKIEDRLWVLLIGVAFSILVPILLKFL